MACFGGGITLITHGLNGVVDGWITGMATNIPAYRGISATNYSCYTMAFAPAGGGGYTLSANRTYGVPATNTTSGEVVIMLDWSVIANGNSYDTYEVASAVTPALLTTNFIPELGGHAISDFPLHLIGHSRGGSLICELSRRLGTNGIWVDHLTTLDPHPLRDPAFPFDAFLYSDIDAPANTYVNVLFHDNYWQNINSLIRGKAVAGAFVRQLTSLNNGYDSPHSNVHLWYHGTINTNTPTSDAETNITALERSAWWVASEQQGANAGFLYSLLGSADRTSEDQPLGGGFPMIRDGYNQFWDLGAGLNNNRTSLPGNNGGWPNLITLTRIFTNAVALGQPMPVQFYYQWAQPGTSLATLDIYLDADANPLNTNQILLCNIALPGTGAGSVGFSATNLLLTATNVVPGPYSVLGKLTAGAQSRFLYAPQSVQVLAPSAPPTLDIVKLTATNFRIGVNAQSGQTVVLESSPDLQSWLPLATNVMTSARWDYTNSPAPGLEANYYRALTP